MHQEEIYLSSIYHTTTIQFERILYITLQYDTHTYLHSSHRRFQKMSSSNFLSKFLSTEHLQGYTRFNAFFLPLSPPRAHTPYSTSCSATPILIFHYDGSCSVGSEGRAAYAEWKVGRGKRSPPAGVVISSVIFAHGTGRSSPRFRRFPTNNGPDIALIRHQGGRGGGWICIVAVVVDRLSPQWVICRSDERRNQRDSGMETLVSTSFQRLIRKGIDWRYLFRVYIRVYFNFFQSWTRFY